MKDDIKIINHVSEYRIKYNMRQSELAEEMGISRQSISSIENGKYMPSLILAFKMAKIFDCFIDDLFVIE